MCGLPCFFVLSGHVYAYMYGVRAWWHKSEAPTDPRPQSIATNARLRRVVQHPSSTIVYMSPGLRMPAGRVL